MMMRNATTRTRRKKKTRMTDLNKYPKTVVKEMTNGHPKLLKLKKTPGRRNTVLPAFAVAVLCEARILHAYPMRMCTA